MREYGIDAFNQVIVEIRIQRKDFFYLFLDLRSKVPRSLETFDGKATFPVRWMGPRNHTPPDPSVFLLCLMFGFICTGTLSP